MREEVGWDSLLGPLVRVLTRNDIALLDDTDVFGSHEEGFSVAVILADLLLCEAVVTNEEIDLVSWRSEPLDAAVALLVVLISLIGFPVSLKPISIREDPLRLKYLFSMLSHICDNFILWKVISCTYGLLALFLCHYRLDSFVLEHLALMPLRQCFANLNRPLVLLFWAVGCRGT